jgi:Mce-associated membrane protein
MTPVDTDSGVDVPEEALTGPAAGTSQRTHRNPSLGLSLDAATTRLAWQAAAVLAVLTVILAGLLVWAPWQDEPTTDRAAARSMTARDEAVDAATQALVTFNTIDHRHMKSTIDAWLELSGGALHRELTRDRSRITARAVRAASDTTAEVLQTAVAAFDAGAGTATVLGVVKVRTTPPRGKPTTNVARFRVLVQHLDSAWKITYLEGVRVSS